MSILSFDEARARVQCEVTAGRVLPPIEEVEIEAAAGRVLAARIVADRDLPPANRSVRDGFAIRAEDVPGTLKVVGEVRAGATVSNPLNPGEAIEIMTGAPLPPGADTVIMVEHVTRSGDGRICFDRHVETGNFINARASDAMAGAALLVPGTRIGYAESALLATVGCAMVAVYKQRTVALVATGDELVPVSSEALPHQVRNSNIYSLTAQVAAAGAIPEALGIAKDSEDETRALIDRGLASDLLLLSGVVSAGKYDLVERVLADMGAEFFFTRVAIQPGQPLVFGRCRGTFFFGLPGNPASTMVTFALFARVAINLLSGGEPANPPFLLARLTQDFRHRVGLTRFLPATIDCQGGLTPMKWSGSGDIPAMCRANAFLVADAGRESWNRGDLISVLLK